MDHNQRFDQLEGLMADMLRRMDQLAAGQNQLAASQERTNSILDGVVEVLKIADQRFAKVEDVLLKADQRFEKVEQTLLRQDERFRRTEERQDATLRLLMQQSENLTAAFRSLEGHDGRLQKLEGNQAA